MLERNVYVWVSYRFGIAQRRCLGGVPVSDLRADRVSSRSLQGERQRLDRCAGEIDLHRVHPLEGLSVHKDGHIVVGSSAAALETQHERACRRG